VTTTTGNQRRGTGVQSWQTHMECAAAHRETTENSERVGHPAISPSYVEESSQTDRLRYICGFARGPAGTATRHVQNAVGEGGTTEVGDRSWPRQIKLSAEVVPGPVKHSICARDNKHARVWVRVEEDKEIPERAINNTGRHGTTRTPTGVQVVKSQGQELACRAPLVAVPSLTTNVDHSQGGSSQVSLYSAKLRYVGTTNALRQGSMLKLLCCSGTTRLIARAKPSVPRRRKGYLTD